MKVIINLNDHVYVKFREPGLTRFAELNEQDHKNSRGHIPLCATPKLDAHGYYKTSLWSLMQDYGNMISLGRESPFETDIVVANS